MTHNPYPSLLKLHSNNMRNYLYRRAFEDGYCGNVQDPNDISASVRALHGLFEAHDVGDKKQHLVTVRRQMEQFIETLFLLTPEKAPLMTVGTPRDWFFFLKHSTIATAVIALRVLMTNETASRGGDHTHAAADVIWSELRMFLTGRYQTMRLHKNHLSSFAAFPAQMVVQALTAATAENGNAQVAARTHARGIGKAEAAAPANRNGQ